LNVKLDGNNAADHINMMYISDISGGSSTMSWNFCKSTFPRLVHITIETLIGYICTLFVEIFDWPVSLL